MYEVELPSQGCNVYYGNYLDNYYSGQRRRYYFNDGQLVLSGEQSYNNLPNGAHCLSSDEAITYKPEVEVYFNVLSIAVCLLLLFAAYRLILHPFWRKK